jgi:hypothetical protein
MAIALSKLMGQDCRRRQSNAFLARPVPPHHRLRLRIELAAEAFFGAPDL